MLLALSFIFHGCAAPPPTAENRGVQPRQEFELSGKVVSVDKGAKRVNIEHKEIPGYMEAMTMPFAVRDPSDLDIMQPGDEVNAKLVVENGRSYLDEITVQRHTPMEPGARLAKPPTDAPSEPEIGAPVPDFKLTDENGKAFTLADQRGRAVLLTFIYTRCPLPDYCPLMTNNLAEIARGLSAVNVPADRVRLLNISFDTAHDTPAVLREYETRTVSDKGARERLTFLTGEQSEVRRTAHYFGLIFSQSTEAVFDHSLRTALIAPDGKLVKVYRGNEWKPAEAIADINATLTAGDAARG